MKWYRELCSEMALRGYEADPLSHQGERLFVRPTGSLELWLRPVLDVSKDGGFVGAHALMSLTYRELTGGLRVRKFVAHPSQNSAGWTPFATAVERKRYVQWFVETVDAMGECLFAEESERLLERTAQVRHAVRAYLERLPEAASLFELEQKLRVGLKELDRVGAERLASVVGSVTGANLAAALCFLGFEEVVEGGRLFERNFAVPRDKPFWRLPSGPDCFYGHPGVQRIQLLSDRIFMRGVERGFPECVGRS